MGRHPCFQKAIGDISRFRPGPNPQKGEWGRNLGGPISWFFPKKWGVIGFPLWEIFLNPGDYILKWAPEFFPPGVSKNESYLS